MIPVVALMRKFFARSFAPDDPAIGSIHAEYIKTVNDYRLRIGYGW